MNDQVASTQIAELLTRTTQALETLARNSEPKTKPHALDDMSNEEVALVLLKRGKIKTKRQCAEILGLNERTVQGWQFFGIAFNSIKAKERLGTIRRGTNYGNGEVDGIV